MTSTVTPRADMSAPNSPCTDVRVEGRRRLKCVAQALHLRHVPEGRGEGKVCAHSGPRITDRIEQARKLRYHDERSAAKAEASRKVELNEVTSDTSLGRKHAGE